MDSMVDSCQAMMALTQVPGLGPVLIKKLVEAFDHSALKIWQTPLEERKKVPGIGKKVLEAMETLDWNKVSCECKKAEQNQIKILYYKGPGYPELLCSLYDPPPILYVKGHLKPEDRRAIAIVGTREPTSYGRRMAYHLAQELGKRKITVVSGLARGIDIAAHQGALSVKGRTLAVLGSGLRQIYPPEHAKMAEAIAQNGALISEYSLDEPPLSYHFPQRNRIISGLSLGVVVVEGKKDSGAMITADCALDQGREVFAIPGEMGRPQSEGPHWLIQQGAKLVSSMEDIGEEIPELFEKAEISASPLAPTGLSEDVPLSFPLSVFSTEPTSISMLEKLSQEQKKIWEALSSSPQNMEVLALKTSLPPSLLANELLKMEMNGLIQALPGQGYRKINRE